MESAVDAAVETIVHGLAAVGPAHGGRLLVLGATVHPEFHRWNEVLGWQPFKPAATAWEAAGFPRSDTLPDGKWPLVACLPGKSKEEILHSFALARDRVADGGIVITALPNQAGAGRFEKLFASAAGRVESLSKHKCRAFWAVADGSWDESAFRQWRALGEPQPIAEGGFRTVPGIFSAGRIDPGSRFLADHLPRDLRGTVADLGAGWGYLSGQALSTCPAIERIDLYEADFRALECARDNLSFDAARAAFHWHDVTAGVAGPYDAILSNPPFHTGQDRDTPLGCAFLTSAARALRRNGRLFLVANRQLPYESHLDALGLRWRNAGENATYKLLFATA